jgi:hypothetical protein
MDKNHLATNSYQETITDCAHSTVNNTASYFTICILVYMNTVCFRIITVHLYHYS